MAVLGKTQTASAEKPALIFSTQPTELIAQTSSSAKTSAQNRPGSFRAAIKAIGSSPSDNQSMIDYIFEKNETAAQKLLLKFGFVRASSTKILFFSERGPKGKLCPQDSVCLALGQPAIIVGEPTPHVVGIVKIGGVWVE